MFQKCHLDWENLIKYMNSSDILVECTWYSIIDINSSHRDFLWKAKLIGYLSEHINCTTMPTYMRFESIILIIIELFQRFKIFLNVRIMSNALCSRLGYRCHSCTFVANLLSKFNVCNNDLTEIYSFKQCHYIHIMSRQIWFLHRAALMEMDARLHGCNKLRFQA